jgi:hypothetical protein
VQHEGALAEARMSELFEEMLRRLPEERTES